MEELRTLVERAKHGDLDAFSAIVGRFQDMALGYAYSVVGDFHLAEDVAQEAFVNAYQSLGELREPDAFPGWLRKIVYKHCDRIKRRKRLQTVPLESAMELPSGEPGPSAVVEKREMRDAVRQAISSLAEGERTVVTLFYINGYTQKDIAAFLEAPVTTVNNRLHSARTRLKERMVRMVNDEMKSRGLPKEFPERIRQLLELPRPLEIEGHPVRELWLAFRECFPDFEEIELDEIVPRKVSTVPPEAMARHVHSVDAERILRAEVTSQLVDRWLQTSPGPRKWITAGRTFRRVDAETRTSLEVFHQAEVFWVEEGLGERQLLDSVQRCVSQILPGTECSFRDSIASFPYMGVSRDFDCPWRGGMLEIGAGGIGSSETLKRAVPSSDRLGSIHFAFGLERCAMVKYDIGDARELWRPPFVPEKRK